MWPFVSLRVASLATVPLLLLGACAPAPAAAPTPAATTKPSAPAPTAPKPTDAPSPTATPAAAKPASSPAAAPGPAVSASPSVVASRNITLPKPEKTAVTIGHAATEINVFTAEYAKILGLYKKYGVEAETTAFDGGSKATATLLAGQIEAMTTGAPPAVASQITDVPLVQVATYMDKVTDNLVARSDIKTPAELKGKTIAVSQLGTDSHASVLLALKGLNIPPTDVIVVQIGGQSARIAALQAGSVAAAPIDGAIEQEMTNRGFNILIRLAEAKAQVARSGLVLTREFVTTNPNTTLALVAANLEAHQRMFENPDAAVDAFMAWTRIPDRAQADKAVKDYLKLARRDLRWEPGAWAVAKEVQESINPALKDVDVSKAYSFTFLDRLRDLGFNDAVGLPRS